MCNHPCLWTITDHLHSSRPCPVGDAWVSELWCVMFPRDNFKIQLQFCPVPASFYRAKQWQPPGTGRNRRSTGGWILRSPLIKSVTLVKTVCPVGVAWVSELGVWCSLLNPCPTEQFPLLPSLLYRNAFPNSNLRKLGLIMQLYHAHNEV